MADPQPTSSKTQRERAARQSVFLLADVRRQGGQAATCRVRNISATGMGVEWQEPLKVGDILEAQLRGIGTVQCVVVRVSQRVAGVRFANPIDPAACLKPLTPAKEAVQHGWLSKLKNPYMADGAPSTASPRPPISNYRR